jgi:hypothetical protein
VAVRGDLRVVKQHVVSPDYLGFRPTRSTYWLLRLAPLPAQNCVVGANEVVVPNEQGADWEGSLRSGFDDSL